MKLNSLFFCCSLLLLLLFIFTHSLDRFCVSLLSILLLYHYNFYQNHEYTYRCNAIIWWALQLVSFENIRHVCRKRSSCIFKKKKNQEKETKDKTEFKKTTDQEYENKTRRNRSRKYRIKKNKLLQIVRCVRCAVLCCDCSNIHAITQTHTHALSIPCVYVYMLHVCDCMNLSVLVIYAVCVCVCGTHTTQLYAAEHRPKCIGTGDCLNVSTFWAQWKKITHTHIYYSAYNNTHTHRYSNIYMYT